MCYKIEKSEKNNDILIIILPDDNGYLRIGYINDTYLIFHFDNNDEPIVNSRYNKVRAVDRLHKIL